MLAVDEDEERLGFFVPNSVIPLLHPTKMKVHYKKFNRTLVLYRSVLDTVYLFATERGLASFGSLSLVVSSCKLQPCLCASISIDFPSLSVR